MIIIYSLVLYRFQEKHESHVHMKSVLGILIALLGEKIRPPLGGPAAQTRSHHNCDGGRQQSPTYPILCFIYVAMLNLSFLFLICQIINKVIEHEKHTNRCYLSYF